MARVIITKALYKEVRKTFMNESIIIFKLMKSLEENPKKGKILSTIGKIVIKEIKYRKFRFYFITDGHKLKFASNDELSRLIIKFIRMSEKKDQKKTIDSLKQALTSLGFDNI